MNTAYLYDDDEQTLYLAVPTETMNRDPRVDNWEFDDDVLKVYVRYRNGEADLLPFGLPGAAMLTISRLDLVALPTLRELTGDSVQQAANS